MRYIAVKALEGGKEPVMDHAKLARADKLEAEAARLRQDAFLGRAMPDFWRVGQKVRFLRNADYTWVAGQIGEIVALREPGTPAAQYQVFWTKPVSGDGLWWTTPDDVELVEDVSPYAAP